MKKSAKRIHMLCAAMLLLCLSVSACAQGYDAQTAGIWLEQFGDALAGMTPINDPFQTADPARAGEMLLEYEFGTVLARRASAPGAQDILEIDLRGDQVSDCRGVRVGMGLEQALGGMQARSANTPLYVLGTQESGYGWSWAYVSDGEIYGVEHITYGEHGAVMTEYTLTYVIDGGRISAIRMKMSPATQAQAQEGLATAEEIASRQQGEVMAMASGAPVFDAADLQVMGRRALGVEVARLIAAMGEPNDVQTLPRGSGRMLVYDGAVVRLSFDAYTGMEVVRGVSVSSAAYTGPRGLAVGMAVQEAAVLFRCDGEVSSFGGVLYLEGEAMGEPPYGELAAGAAGEMVLRYACAMEDGRVAVLEAGVREGVIAYWRLFDQTDTEGGV